MKTIYSTVLLSLFLFNIFPNNLHAQIELKTDLLVFLHREIGLAIETPISENSSINFEAAIFISPNEPKYTGVGKGIDFSLFHYHDAFFFGSEYRYNIKSENQKKTFFIGGSIKYRYTKREKFDYVFNYPVGTSRTTITDICQESHSLGIGILFGFKRKLSSRIFLESYCQIGRFDILSVKYSNAFDVVKTYPNSTAPYGDELPRLDFRISMNLNIVLSK
tara:strand:- start:337 stop:996 length:660 start_codon:yes stop_codon:yes gene_type:complete